MFVELAQQVGERLVAEQRRQGANLGAIEVFEEFRGVVIQQLAGKRAGKVALVLRDCRSQAIQNCFRRRRGLRHPIHGASSVLGTGRVGRFAQDLDDPAHRQARRGALLVGRLGALLDLHQVVAGLRAHGHGHTAHDWSIVALRDVVADTVGHWTTAFLDNKNPRCRFRRVPRMLSDGGG